jgi:S-adenosylmethionine:tRNA ribosyltransferase-isomerase
MKTEELNYHLPSELIAQQPVSVRSDSRLLVLNRTSGDILDSRFSKLGDFLLPGDCLVLNDTRVVPARFFARRSSGGKLEGLFLAADADGIWHVYLKGARKTRPGDTLYLKDKRKGDFCEAVFLEKTSEGECLLGLKTDADAQSILKKIGFPGLPPYIKRDDDPDLAEKDRVWYQTVYASKAGAVAAPTAGLHFTEELIARLKRCRISFAYVTLHVGAGTFKPMTAENVEDHQIHREQFSIDEDNARVINTAKNNGGRIIPVGTTSTRVLETVAANSQIEAASPVRNSLLRDAAHRWRLPYNGAGGTTELFIKPGYKFKITDAMITNFHLPKSTLLALVAAFAGLRHILAAYNHAIDQRYRFYSYGDAMLITKY